MKTSVRPFRETHTANVDPKRLMFHIRYAIANVFMLKHCTGAWNFQRSAVLKLEVDRKPFGNASARRHGRTILKQLRPHGRRRIKQQQSINLNNHIGLLIITASVWCELRLSNQQQMLTAGDCMSHKIKTTVLIFTDARRTPTGKRAGCYRTVVIFGFALLLPSSLLHAITLMMLLVCCRCSCCCWVTTIAFGGFSLDDLPRF